MFDHVSKNYSVYVFYEWILNIQFYRFTFIDLFEFLIENVFTYSLFWQIYHTLYNSNPFFRIYNLTYFNWEWKKQDEIN